MKYYYKIVFNKGAIMAGHNCTHFELNKEFLILERIRCT